MSIQCWPNGHGTRPGDCDEELPDDSAETMRRFGWGFTYARDDASPDGIGPFLACPEHRDCDNEEMRDAARAALAKAKTAADAAEGAPLPTEPSDRVQLAMPNGYHERLIADARRQAFQESSDIWVAINSLCDALEETGRALLHAREHSSPLPTEGEGSRAQQSAITVGAAAICDLWFGGPAWRERMDQSEMLESADWARAVEYAAAVLKSRTPQVAGEGSRDGLEPLPSAPVTL